MLYKEKLKYPNENKEPIYKTYREKFDKKKNTSQKSYYEQIVKVT